MHDMFSRDPCGCRSEYVKDTADMVKKAVNGVLCGKCLKKLGSNMLQR